MKKAAFGFLLAVLLGITATSAQGQFSGTWRITTAIQPIGVFYYAVQDYSYVTSSPLVVASGIVEYSFLGVGIGAYIEFRSHRWNSIDSESPLIAQIMGAPGFAGGLLVFNHFSPSQSPWDLYIAAGLGCNLYFPSITDIQPGLDLAVEAGLNYAISPTISIGPRFCARRSTHAGGIPDPDGGGGILLPYFIFDIDLGFAARFELSH